MNTTISIVSLMDFFLASSASFFCFWFMYALNTASSSETKALFSPSDLF